MNEQVIERVGADDWHQYPGHCQRYEWAATKLRPGEVVNDVACGVGYGAKLLGPTISYHGYDKPGVAAVDQFVGRFYACDLDAPDWEPAVIADATTCFETLEHVADPHRLAAVLADFTRRAVMVSVPTQPTTHANPHHRHDFTVEQIPPMFPGFLEVERWAQPEELSHVWLLERPR